MNIFNGELFLRYGKIPLEKNLNTLPDFIYTDILSKIYQVSVNEKGIFYRTRDNDGKLSSFKQTNYYKVEEELIPLSTILLNSEYFGLPANINYVTWNKQQDIINGIILYRNSLYTLVYDLESSNLLNKYIPLKVINNKNLISYVVTGEKTNVYNNPKNLYHDLFIEILETTKKKNRGKQK